MLEIYYNNIMSEIISGNEYLTVPYNYNGEEREQFIKLDKILLFIEDHELNQITENKCEGDHVQNSYTVTPEYYFEINRDEVLQQYIESFLKEQYKRAPFAHLQVA